MPKPGRAATRWGLPAIGLAALACVGCCALPLLAAGSIIGGGLALMRDSCFAPLAILLLVIGLATSALWIRRLNNKDNKYACGEGADCGCAPADQPEMLQPNTSRPGP